MTVVLKIQVTVRRALYVRYPDVYVL